MVDWKETYSNDNHLITSPAVSIFSICASLSFFPLCTECFVRQIVIWVALTVSSPSELSLVFLLLQFWNIISASHSSRFYVVFLFQSLMVNIKYCTICVICAQMMYCDPLLRRGRGINWLLTSLLLGGKCLVSAQGAHKAVPVLIKSGVTVRN